MKYSQNNEEEAALLYFGSRIGTFLDIGANDGETLSNTRALALAGWSGVCVDASPAAFKRLVALYADNPAIECHQLAVAEACKTAKLHESGTHLRNGDIGLLSTMFEGEKKRWESSGEKFDPVEVEAVDFTTLMDRCARKRFDMISIDIEGADLMVLLQINLTALGCSMVIVEVNDRDPNPYIEHCAAHGLNAYVRNPENLIIYRHPQ